MKFVTLLLSIMSLMHAKYYSQCGQDRFMNEQIFHNKKNGVFIDIGSHDGILYSNSNFFEKELNWSGLCIEANPDIFKNLTSNRTCKCINTCIVPFENMDLHFLKITGYAAMLSGIYEFYDPKHLQRIQHELQVNGGDFEMIKLSSNTFNEILNTHNINSVDFLSLDIEGGELDILKTIDYKKYDIKVVAVENNYNDKNFELFMNSKGYILLNNLYQDQIFIQKEFHDSLK